jgi:hypothetical protein
VELRTHGDDPHICVRQFGRLSDDGQESIGEENVGKVINDQVLHGEKRREIAFVVSVSGARKKRKTNEE